MPRITTRLAALAALACLLSAPAALRAADAGENDAGKGKRDRIAAALYAVADALAGTGRQVTGHAEDAAAQARETVDEAAERAADEAALRLARLWSRASVAAARRIRPSVANITTEREAHAPISSVDPFFDDFFRMLRPSRPRRSVGQGSGVIVDPAGYILTNHHVIRDADSIAVNLPDGRTFRAELIGSDPDSDIAVIKIDGAGLVAAEFGDSDELEVGETVLAVGNPFGLDSTVTSGIVSARGRANVGIIEREDFIQTDAAINPGNSGGPLIDLNGKVVGINTAIFSRSGGYQGIGFAIPANLARTMMDSLIAHRRVVAVDLGLETQDLTAPLAKAFGLAAPRGALVNAVRADSPGARAGVRRSDVVVKYGARDIPDDRTFRNLVALTPPGQEVELTLVRGGETQRVMVRVEAVPEVVEIERKAGMLLEGLGIKVEEITPALAERYKLPENQTGLVVTEMERWSVLRRKYLWPGSVILNVDGEAVRTKDELHQALARADLRKGLSLQWQTQNRVFPPFLIRAR